jgi:hypothetical protein
MMKKIYLKKNVTKSKSDLKHHRLDPSIPVGLSWGALGSK